METNGTALTKKCTKCCVLKPLTDYHKDSRLRDGRNSQCKACYNSARLATNKDYRSSEHGKQVRKFNQAARFYGITKEQAEKLYNQPCKLCGSTENLCIDHNHKTGEVRGTLCNGCNVMVGYYEKCLSFGLARITNYLGAN